MNAFDGCESLRSVTLPSTVAYIKKDAFIGCESLEEIVFNGTIDEWNSIKKDESWNGDAEEFTVKCTDGDVSFGDEDDIDFDDVDFDDIDIVLSSDIPDEDPNAELDAENEELFNSLADLFTGDDEETDDE